MKNKEAFWSGFATGAGSGIGALLAWNAFSSPRNRRILKAALEGQERTPSAEAESATGTFGKTPESAGVPQTQHARFGGVEQAVEYTRPTQPAPFSQPDAKR